MSENILFQGDKIKKFKNIAALFIHCKSKIKVKINNRDL